MSESFTIALISAACTYVATAIPTVILSIRLDTTRDRAIELLVQHRIHKRKCSCRGCQEAAEIFRSREDMLDIHLRMAMRE